MSGPRELCAASSPPPPPPRAAASLFSHHILSTVLAGPWPCICHSAPPAFRPPPHQASCLGDLLPAPLLPDLGMVTLTGPALRSDSPWALGPQIHAFPSLFLPRGTSQPLQQEVTSLNTSPWSFLIYFLASAQPEGEGAGSSPRAQDRLRDHSSGMGA